MQNFFQDKFSSLNGSKLARYYTGLILIAIVATIIILNIKFLSWAFLGACFLLAFAEALKLFNILFRFHLYVAATLIWLLALFCAKPLYIAILALTILASYNAYYQKSKNRDYLPLLYPTIPFLCFWSIYNDFGAMAIVWLIVIVALTDICAFFGGKAFGKSPLSPVSPKKTIEGAIIGLIVASLVGTIIGISISVDGVRVGFISAFFIAFLVSFISIFGDLYESMLKRAANVKDSGNILPGHGGMLDRVDGILFGAVMMLFLLEWL